MTKETYAKLTGAMRRNAKLTHLLNILNKVLTYLILQHILQCLFIFSLKTVNVCLWQ